MESVERTCHLHSLKTEKQGEEICLLQTTLYLVYIAAGEIPPRVCGQSLKLTGCWIPSPEPVVPEKQKPVEYSKTTSKDKETFFGRTSIHQYIPFLLHIQLRVAGRLEPMIHKQPILNIYNWARLLICTETWPENTWILGNDTCSLYKNGMGKMCEMLQFEIKHNLLVLFWVQYISW